VPGKGRLKIPAASPVFGGEQAGIVLTVSASPVEQGEKAGELAAKALRGENPSGVESPRRIEVIVNLREARELDLKIPLDLLSSATRVIK
jgi:putative ABC transport system substrate-binding protein